MAWIDVEGAANMRDLGGTPTEDGGKILPNRLLRADNLQTLTERDVDLLVGGIGVTTVVDLRSPAEVTREGPGPLDAVPSVRHAFHPVLAQLADQADAAAEALLVKKMAVDQARYPEDVTCGHYLGYLEERPGEVIGALRDIATSPGAAIVHCAAGKDRTGVIVALALTAAGVAPDLVIADYAASAERIDAVLDRLRVSATYAPDAGGKPVSAHTPRAETMKAFLNQLDVRYGGLSAWLTANGFTAGDLGRLRARLRES
ncbi:MAG TPA: tyrosine-protein phosphatase [Trebonia sp.]|jgi:protein tyrosine/serine phosphatase|nr:tyrosine-protein phosphatase [Trebonia sp.]